MISEQPRKMWGGRQYNWTAVHLNVQKKNKACLFLDTLVPPNSILRHNRTFAGANSFKYELTLKWSAFFVTLFSFNKVPSKRLEHSRTREKYVSCFPLTILSCCSRFLRALQKNRAHSQGFVICQLAATLFQLSISYSSRSFFRWILPRRYTCIHFPGTTKCIYQRSYRANCRTKTTQGKAYSCKWRPLNSKVKISLRINVTYNTSSSLPKSCTLTW